MYWYGVCSFNASIHIPKCFRDYVSVRKQVFKNAMTFPMSENKSIKILMDDESSEENQKSAKEIEDDKRAEKEAQQKLVSM